jgi:esterase/lipase superfamily enzyme
MRRDQIELDAPGLDRPGTLIRYGHWGRPVVVFPTELGRAWEYEENGMVGALASLIDDGRIKLYCVDSFDHMTWSDTSISHEERARRYREYERWVTDAVVPVIRDDSPGAGDLITTGASLGAYHALHLMLARADLFTVAICQSGNYDPSFWRTWGERGDDAYFTNPMDYLRGADGDHLDWLRSRVYPVLVVGQGEFEVDPTGALPATFAMDRLLTAKGIDHELDVWGHDVSHQWPWWREQIAHHLPRFC